MKLLLVLSLVSLIEAQTKINFEVTQAQFVNISCEAQGFRCGYWKENFTTVILSPGSQDSVAGLDDFGNALWLNSGSVDNFLVLGGCVGSTTSCRVQCNFGCNCVDRDGNDCRQITVAPTPAPSPPKPTANRQCAVQRNLQLCSQVFPVLPAGALDQFKKYDCHNFCNYTYSSGCYFSDSCSYATNCSVQGQDGTKYGLVAGCTPEMLLAGQGTMTSMAATTTTTNWERGGVTMIMMVLSFVSATMVLW